MPDPTDPRAVAAQPALGYDPDCPECSGTGQRDSGGTHPWGEPAMMMCDCDAPPRAVADESIAEMRIAINRVPLDPSLAAEIAADVAQFLDGATQASPVADDPSGIVQQMPEGAGDVLSPCPFCGAPAEIVHIDGGELAGGSCVTCTKCLACSNVEFEFKENFVSNWNRRATEADLRAEVERLRANAKGMRALLRAGCDLLADEYDNLKDSITMPGGGFSTNPLDAWAVEKVVEMDDWIASVKATLFPPALYPETNGE